MFKKLGEVGLEAFSLLPRVANDCQSRDDASIEENLEPLGRTAWAESRDHKEVTPHDIKRRHSDEKRICPRLGISGRCVLLTFQPQPLPLAFCKKNHLTAVP